MNSQMNGWTVLVILGALVIILAFSWMTTRFLIPGMTAQIAGNQQLLQNIQRDFQAYDKALAARFEADEARRAKIEGRSAPAPQE